MIIIHYLGYATPFRSWARGPWVSKRPQPSECTWIVPVLIPWA